MEKTPWFDGSVKPVRKGVYERLYDEGTSAASVDFCFFDGEWMMYADTVKGAAAETIPSALQSLKWRGLTKPPKGTP